MTKRDNNAGCYRYQRNLEKPTPVASNLLAGFPVAGRSATTGARAVRRSWPTAVGLAPRRELVVADPDQKGGAEAGRYGKMAERVRVAEGLVIVAYIQ